MLFGSLTTGATAATGAGGGAGVVKGSTQVPVGPGCAAADAAAAAAVEPAQTAVRDATLASALSDTSGSRLCPERAGAA